MNHDTLSTRPEDANRTSLFSDLDFGKAVATANAENANDAGEDLEASGREENSSLILNLVDRILIEALMMKASDIHMEPQDDRLLIRFRMDGVLRDIESLPKKMTPAVTSRVKIMRLLDNIATQEGLDGLITAERVRQLVRNMGSKPFGMILVTGPTGSGKSTTLYALIAERNDPAINICTVEDPIEYSLRGITQTQVNREKGYDFSVALRAFMRQDPDVLLVGETRDIETAKTAIEAALTGHLVLTTLHCNDSVSAFARLDEMGVEPFLVSASLLGVVSQRLVRKLCSDCRIPHQPGENELAHFGLMGTNESIPHFFRACTVAAGSEGACPRCNGRGYSGRVGVYEVLTMTESLATAVSRRASTNELRRLAIESGMKTLLGYGLELVRGGLTSLEEVERMLLTDTGLESERQARALSTLTCKGCGAGLQDEWLECPYCLATRS